MIRAPSTGLTGTTVESPEAVPPPTVLPIRIGQGWAKAHQFSTGECPVMRYNRALMEAILHDRVQIAKAVNATVLPLEEAPNGYEDFDRGEAKKFVLDPHGMLAGKTV
ncbi:hypothetical protein [Actinopolymorpha rutila]|uniref:Threonine dehydrogenase-like Zn-dependent dehydrogenase n=1 Tax=Actinopolymorpha rutila TaxID=446787 RepID=A0A852Z896_9ACTN|nr:hypothetical protein [Actinopolymorpha rutila]NYH88082.1 threonine dehydrogenase-like Zn-dependent dehydrogenase [Actinopolymorpha rutila]